MFWFIDCLLINTFVNVGHYICVVNRLMSKQQHNVTLNPIIVLMAISHFMN